MFHSNKKLFSLKLITIVLRPLCLFILFLLAQKMWTIVIFQNENTIECVPQNWITSCNKCYWPPYKGQKLAASIASCQAPDSEWNIFSIRLLNEDKKYGESFC